MTTVTDNAPGAEPELSRAEQILRAREARVLVWALITRLAALGIAVGLSVLQLWGVIPLGVIAESELEAIAVIVLAGRSEGWCGTGSRWPEGSYACRRWGSA